MESYKIFNKAQFLELLEVSEEELRNILNSKADSYYEYIVINKGKIRKISAIKKNSALYILQKNLQKSFFVNIYFPSNVYGFVKQKNYIDYLLPHCSSMKTKCFTRLDIKNFFNSIDVKHVREYLKGYVDDTCDITERDYIIDNIIDIITLNNQVTQGAITSPFISNLAFRRIDIRIERFCDKNNVIYTRYADDMLFSCFDDLIHKQNFMYMIISILKDYNFSLNFNKTLKMTGEISLNGYVLGNDIRLSRKKFEIVNLILFNLSAKKISNPISRQFKYKLINILAGYRALFIQVMRYTYDNEYKQLLTRKIKEVEKAIDKISDFNEESNGNCYKIENEILKEIYLKKHR